MLHAIALQVHVFAMSGAILLFAASEFLLIPVRRRSANAALLANRVANLFATIGFLVGIALIYIGGWPLSTPWLLLSFVLFAMLMLIGRRYVQPWLSVAATSLGENVPAAEIKTVVHDRRALFGRISVLAIFALIAVLMVAKPDLGLRFA
jgi:uncharacterized membrane protein